MRRSDKEDGGTADQASGMWCVNGFVHWLRGPRPAVLPVRAFRAWRAGTTVRAVWPGYSGVAAARFAAATSVRFDTPSLASTDETWWSTVFGEITSLMQCWRWCAPRRAIRALPALVGSGEMTSASAGRATTWRSSRSSAVPPIRAAASRASRAFGPRRAAPEPHHRPSPVPRLGPPPAPRGRSTGCRR